MIEIEPWLTSTARDEDRRPFAALDADSEVMEHYPSTLTWSESDAFVDRIENGFEETGGHVLYRLVKPI